MHDVSMIETYSDLLTALQKLTPEQLQQKVQIAQAGNCDDSVPVVLQPAVCIGTVRELYSTFDAVGNVENHQIVRDCNNGRHNPDSIVITTDTSGFEDDTVFEQRRIAIKALESIKEYLTSSLLPDRQEMARVALEKIKKIAEKKKERILKECA